MNTKHSNGPVFWGEERTHITNWKRNWSYYKAIENEANLLIKGKEDTPVTPLVACPDSTATPGEFVIVHLKDDLLVVAL